MSVDRRARVTGTSVILFCLSLFVTAYSARNPNLVSVGNGAVAELLRPLQYVTSGTVDFFSGIWGRYVASLNLQEDHEALLARVRSLERDKSILLELQQENERLRKLVNLSAEQELDTVAARVIAYDASNWVQAVAIDKGMADGLQKGLAVITAEGVVGQVIATGLNASRVLLITDHSSGVDALVQGGRARGILEGISRKSLRWRFVLEQEEVRVGDRLVTSGLDGVFPHGLFLGRVIDIERDAGGMFQVIEVSPGVDFSKLEEVLVVTGPRPDLEIPENRRKP